MTRKEAITRLNNVIKVVANQNTIEAIEMAIEALECIEAYEGNGYYFMFEAQESEDKE